MAIFATENEKNGMMRLTRDILLAAFLAFCLLPLAAGHVGARDNAKWQELLPREVLTGEQGKFHAQGIAYDRRHQCIYVSFTTALLKFDMQGHLTGSVVGLTGHLGCMALNPDDGLLYASIEYKHDAIGAGIAKGLGGVQNDDEDAFYIAVFDVDRISRQGMDASEVMKTVYIREAAQDYAATVTNQGRVVQHRNGCSGIDGVAVGPRPGKNGGRNVLYIAYGIYGDTSRTDNDYQVILCYDLRHWKRYEQTLSARDLHHSGPEHPSAKYYVLTGNTEWGIQNLAYDSSRNALLAAVYKGRKPDWPNYSLYAVDLSRQARCQVLQGVEPTTEGLVLPLLEAGEQDAVKGVCGWHFGWGSTGLCPLGDGYYYISEQARNAQTGRHSTAIRLYRWDGSTPFVRVEDR